MSCLFRLPSVKNCHYLPHCAAAVAKVSFAADTLGVPIYTFVSESASALLVRELVRLTTNASRP